MLQIRWLGGCFLVIFVFWGRKPSKWTGLWHFEGLFPAGYFNKHCITEGTAFMSFYINLVYIRLMASFTCINLSLYHLLASIINVSVLQFCLKKKKQYALLDTYPFNNKYIKYLM